MSPRPVLSPDLLAVSLLAAPLVLLPDHVSAPGAGRGPEVSTGLSLCSTARLANCDRAAQHH